MSNVQYLKFVKKETLVLSEKIPICILLSDRILIIRFLISPSKAISRQLEKLIPSQKLILQ